MLCVRASEYAYAFVSFCMKTIIYFERLIFRVKLQASYSIYYTSSSLIFHVHTLTVSFLLTMMFVSLTFIYF